MRNAFAIRPCSHLLLALTSALFVRTADANVQTWAAPAVATEVVPSEHDSRVAWWREARFGIFIHWGLYSVAAGEWQGKTSPGAGEWIMNDLQIPVSQYQQLARRFNPVNFDARQWGRLVKGAGAKYLVITSKHHDGFALYPSRLTEWSIKSTPFARDPLKELAEACRAEDIRFGLYYSIMDWHHPDYEPRKPWNDLATSAPDFDRYVRFLKGQLAELLAGYGPVSVLWFDGQWENSWTYERGADLYHYVQALQPGIIVNNRVGTEQPLQPGQLALGDYRTPEQNIPASGLGPGVDWETCMTMNNTWGFKKSDQDWKSVETLIRNLVDCASKGGNYLLNIGPCGDGSIPAASTERLLAIGRWLRVNGEAIYGTGATPFPRAFSWGRCTSKTSGTNTTLYLHVFDWPGEGELLVPGLRTPAASVSLLQPPDNSGLHAETTSQGLVITVPKTSGDPISTTIIVRLAGPPLIEPAAILQKRDGSVFLPASEARLHGSTFQYESGGPLDDIGYWTTPDDWADWEFEIKQPGRFTVSAVIAAPASGIFEVCVAGQTLRCSGPVTGNYVRFKSSVLGSMDLPAGKAFLAVRPCKDGWQPMNLKAIRLEPFSASGPVAH